MLKLGIECENLEDIKCEFCGTEITEELVELSDVFDNQPCDCKVLNEIIDLQIKIRKTKEQIDDLIYKKTDGEVFSEIVKSDLEKLKLVLE